MYKNELKSNTYIAGTVRENRLTYGLQGRNNVTTESRSENKSIGESGNWGQAKEQMEASYTEMAEEAYGKERNEQLTPLIRDQNEFEGESIMTITNPSPISDGL